ncbi:DUF6090 family protein [Gaetbulibacter sp. M240]|uniref:DUF6090 family protein n=1 Tax=Gaetbulibacter sp. M240 TaxID=3126511 RepID=UPI00374FAEC6
MLKFFRKIRQRLLTENKFSKYLIYSLGEIVLVVIGISIALQINNWNENRKRENLKKQLFIELRARIMQDTVDFNTYIKRFESAHKNALLLKERIRTDSPYSNELDSSFSKIQRIGNDKRNLK